MDNEAESINPNSIIIKQQLVLEQFIFLATLSLLH